MYTHVARVLFSGNLGLHRLRFVPVPSIIDSQITNISTQSSYIYFIIDFP